MAKSESLEEACSKPWQSYHTAFTNAKAGMEGVDKEKVQRIVYEMSKGSKYFENEERKEAYIKQKIDNMQAQRAKLTGADISHFQKVADRKIVELEATRDLTRIWLHVDMDAFYAAVETLSNPSLKGKPIAVGGMSMISTANYEARKFGVRAAMPGFIARKLCPRLIFVPVDFKKYTHFSDLTRKVFQRYDPNFIAASLDEAYLDITNVCRERGITSEDVAEELRRGVNEETGLTCSAGVGPNRLLAKVCSDINKPNGQFVLPNDRMAVMTFISSLPIRKIGGIGKVTEHLLRDVFEIKTCEEMLQKGGLLYTLFSQSSADFFLSVGLGLGGTDTPEVRLRKSISNERTFLATNNESLFYGKLGELAAMLSADMEKEGLCGRNLALKLKTASFEVRTRAVTLPNYICSAEDILKHAQKLLKAELPISLRLIGLRMSQFSEDKDSVPSDPTQRTLSNFIISKPSNGKNVDDQSSFGLDLHDHELSYDTSKDLSSSDALLDTNPSICSESHNSGEIETRDGSIMCDPKAKVNGFEVEETARKTYKAEASQSIRTDFLTLRGQIKETSLDAVKKRTHHSDEEAASSSDDKNQNLWVDGYKCIICGVELPPSFAEERQEHSDFHLAERLQNEESHSPSNVIVRQRLNPKDQVVSQNRRKKKLKSSPEAGKHIPIDTFFVKK